MPLFWITRRVKCAKAPFGHDFDKPPVTDQLRLHQRRKIADANTATAAVIAAIAAAVSVGDCSAVARSGLRILAPASARQTRRPKALVRQRGRMRGYRSQRR
jgi:hypothetical protein